MHKEDYYSVLNVSRDASDSDIKKSYKRHAMKYHPDRNPGNKLAEERFKKVGEAYEILSDSNKRKNYDLFGHDGVDPSFASNAYENAGTNFNDVFSSFFGDIFGGDSSGKRKRGSRAKKGSDLNYNLTLDLEEAVRGTTVKIRIKNFVSCDMCGGTGGKKGVKPISCSSCSGTGQIRMQQGFFSIQQTCHYCNGEGKIIKDNCVKCSGNSRVRENKILSVKIPSGIDEGDRIRLSGEGEAGLYSGDAGDLYVKVSVREHKIFTRKNTDLYCEVPISFCIATLGGEVEAPSLNGKFKLKIPKETQTGKLFKLRGKGIRSLHGEKFGDLLCRVIVETPVNLNLKQKELIKELDFSIKKENHVHNPKSNYWIDSVRNFFENIKFNK